MKALLLSLLKEKKQERESIANSNLPLAEIEQRIISLNYEIKALEQKLTTLA